MTSFKQIEANRLNAQRSTGPTTEQGKRRSSRNAVRHGLTAETTIVPIEDIDEYKAFEMAVTTDYEAHTAVERELVLRLASLLWRLRRATAIETGLFQIQGEDLFRDRRSKQQGLATHALGSSEANLPLAWRHDHDTRDDCDSPLPSASEMLDLAHCFLKLSNLENAALERLTRYEAALWRQTRQTLFSLEALGRRSEDRRWHRERPKWRRWIAGERDREDSD